MKDQNIDIVVPQARTASFQAVKKVVAISTLLVAGLGASAETNLSSPKGADVFGAAVPMPPVKTVTIGWSFPAQFETPDLIFKIYQATNLAQPLHEWALLTNLPGYTRDAVLPADQPQQFFIMTASNHLRESDYASSY